MKKKILNMFNTKSNSGFTMYDLIVAIAIITLFTGTIGTLVYNGTKADYKIKLTGLATNYAIQILEEIDKIPYEEVQNDMEYYYINKFNIPQGFDITIEVTNYNEGNDMQDLIKKVKLTITHEFLEESESFVVSHLKVREL